MADIPQAAIDAAASVIHNRGDGTDPCVNPLTHDFNWSQDVLEARRALEAAEAVWPHDPPKRDPASTTDLRCERGPLPTARAPGWPVQPRKCRFGFGPPEVTA